MALRQDRYQVCIDRSMMSNGHTPSLSCRVRARIPTLLGGHFSLFLYSDQPSHSSKSSSPETLSPMALVFNSSNANGSLITSHSLEQSQTSDTSKSRQMRGCQTSTTMDGLSNGFDGSQAVPLVRVHSACFTGETVYSARCDCGQQLESAIEMMSPYTLEPSSELNATAHSTTHQSGVIIYLPQEGRSIGLEDKLKAYNLQDIGYDTVEANELLSHPPDARQYSHAAEILADLGIGRCNLLTNNPDKIKQLRGYGIDVVERVALHHQHSLDGNVGARSVHHEMCGYIRTKVERMGHLIELLPQQVGTSVPPRKSL